MWASRNASLVQVTRAILYLVGCTNPPVRQHWMGSIYQTLCVLNQLMTWTLSPSRTGKHQSVHYLFHFQESDHVPHEKGQHSFPDISIEHPVGLSSSRGDFPHHSLPNFNPHSTGMRTIDRLIAKFDERNESTYLRNRPQFVSARSAYRGSAIIIGSSSSCKSAPVRHSTAHSQIPGCVCTPTTVCDETHDRSKDV